MTTPSTSDSSKPTPEKKDENPTVVGKVVTLPLEKKEEVPATPTPIVIPVQPTPAVVDAVPPIDKNKIPATDITDVAERNARLVQAKKSITTIPPDFSARLAEILRQHCSDTNSQIQAKVAIEALLIVVEA